PSPSYIHTLSLHDALPISNSFRAFALGGRDPFCSRSVSRLTARSLLSILPVALWRRLMTRLRADRSTVTSRMSFLAVTSHNDCRSEEHTSELQSPDHLVCR